MEKAALIAELKALAAEARARADERRPNDLPPPKVYESCLPASDRRVLFLIRAQSPAFVQP